jgi:hypothetical protein
VLISGRSGVGLTLIIASIILAGCVRRVVSVELVEKTIKEQVPIV